MNIVWLESNASDLRTTLWLNVIEHSRVNLESNARVLCPKLSLSSIMNTEKFGSKAIDIFAHIVPLVILLLLKLNRTHQQVFYPIIFILTGYCHICRYVRCRNIFFLEGWILLMTTKFSKPVGRSKLLRHPRWDFFAPVNSTGRCVPPPSSTGRLQLLCQCFFQAMRGSTQQLSN